MDVSDLRKRILRALDDGRKDASDRRTERDEAAIAYELFVNTIAEPLLRQAGDVLKAERHAFVVNTPASGPRLQSERAGETFIEFALERSGARPHVIGRVSLARGRQGVVVDEQVIAPDKKISEISDDDVATFLVAEVAKLVAAK